MSPKGAVHLQVRVGFLVSHGRWGVSTKNAKPSCAVLGGPAPHFFCPNTGVSLLETLRLQWAANKEYFSFQTLVFNLVNLKFCYLVVREQNCYNIVPCSCHSFISTVGHSALLCTYHSLYSHNLVCGRLSCLQVFADTNKDTVDILIRVPRHTSAKIYVGHT